MFYYNLTKLCKKKGISLSTLIKDLDMSTGNLSKWKNGKIPKMDTIIKIAEYFDVSVDYLINPEKVNETHKLKQEIVFNNSAKIPIFNQDNKNIIHNKNEDDSILTNVSKPHNYLYLKVFDNSMAKSGILKDSLVLIKKDLDIKNGEIICYFKDDKVFLKRFKIDNKYNFIVLTSENIDIEPIIIKNLNIFKNEFTIVGKAVEVRTCL